MTTNESYQATLLVVDDIPTNLKVLLTYLHNQNFKVLVAQDGEDALKKVRQVTPDLILLDVMMPKMDGFETCRQLKGDEKTRDIPVIFMTALTDTMDKVKGFSVGGVDYVTKPVQHEEVLARINTHLTLRNLRLTLEQQNRETQMFAHTMANDLKNPLLRMAGLTDLLGEDLKSTGSDQDVNFVEELSRTSNHMLNTVDALLLLMSVRTPTVPKEPLDMGELVTSAGRRLDYLIQNQHAKLEIPAQWPQALGYAPWIEEVWINYLSNALKYGGRPPHITTGAEPDPETEGFIRFWVEDNGSGISEQNRENLFAPTAGNLDLSDTKGYGLGLSIVQRMVRKCGGQVGAENGAGGGSRFYFTLPAAREK